MKKIKCDCGHSFIPREQDIFSHRVMCGDNTNPDDVKKLLGKKKVDCLYTDPPYFVDYQGDNSFLKVINRGNRAQFALEGNKDIKPREFFASFLKLVPVNDYNTCFIWMAGMHLTEMIDAMTKDADFTWGDNLAWIKNHFVFGRKNFKSMYEFTVYGWKGRHKFYGENNISNVFFEDKPQVSDLHPTMKPISIVAKHIIYGSQPGMLIYDPFGGSGTTLIACEQQERTCYMMELVPHFVDVICKRWEILTNHKAKKVL